MPSPFRIRQALRLKPRLDGSQQSDAMSLGPAQTTFPTMPRMAISVDDNDAFALALQRHLEKLDEVEREAFSKAYQNITMEGLLAKVSEFDNAHNEKAMCRRCAEPVSRFLKITEQFMQGLAIGIQSSPEISSLVVGAVRIVIDVAVRFVTFFNRLTEMMIWLSDHLEHLLEYSKASREAKLLQAAVANIYGDLLDFCRQARLVFVNEQGVERSELLEWTSIRIFIRVQWEPFEASFGTIDSNFRHHLEVLLHTSQALQLRDLVSERRQTQQRESLEERKRFLRWLSELNFDEDHDKFYSKRHPGTGNWLIQEKKFQQWFNSDTSALLWCVGRPGAGKSVLASIVLEYVTSKHGLDDNVGVAFAYFKYNSLASQHPSQVVSTFIKQLCWKKEQIPQYLLDFYHTYDWDARIPAFDKYKDNFFRLANSFGQIFVVLDALDECQQDEENGIFNREQIMDFIFDLTDRAPCAKVFLTSRRETDIRDALTRHQTPTIQIEVKSVAEDINAYVSDHVENLLKVKKLKLRKPALKEKIVKTLVANAEGMFLWANLQLLNICKQRSDQDIEAELGNIPRGLHWTYARILQRICQQPIAIRELARRCLVWVFYSARPLHIRELLEAIQIGESTRKRENSSRYKEEAIIEACANLIEVNYGLVQPIHQSVKEYFTTQQESTIQESFREFFVNSTTGHTILSFSCLSYLLQGFLDAGPCKERDSFYYLSQRYSLASYSSYFFDSHLRQVSVVPEELKKLLERFFSSRSTAFAAIMQLRALGGRRCEISIMATPFTAMFPEIDASILIHSTALVDHPGLHEKIKGLLLVSNPRYIMHQVASAGLLNYAAQLFQEHKVDERDSHNKSPLHYAAMNGHREMCCYLLNNGANAAAKDDEGNTVLHLAAISGNEAVVRLLLEDYGADATAKDDEGSTVLHLAAISGNEAVVRLLLEDYGADATAKDDEGITVLHWAAISGNEAVVRLLLEDYGADATAKDDIGSTVLHLAAISGNEAVVRLLLEDYGADATAKDDIGRTVLHLAAIGGNEAVVRLLLEDYGADATAKDDEGRTVLHLAAMGVNEAVVRLLLEDYGADATAKDDEGSTVLHLAAMGRNEAVVRLLLEDYGADATAKDDIGITVLHWAAISGNEAVVRLLLEDYGADAIAKDDEGNTVLHWAAGGGNEAVVRLLLEDYEADATAKDDIGRTVLHLAAIGGNEAVVRLLLEDYGADATAKDDIGITVLHWAVGGGNEAVVQLLLKDYKADITMKDNEGSTVLHWAAKNGNEAVVRLLLEDYGADATAKNDEGLTVLHWAAKNGNEAVVRLLLEEYKADATVKDDKGWTVLRWAENCGHGAVVQVLIEKGQ